MVISFDSHYSDDSTWYVNPKFEAKFPNKVWVKERNKILSKTVVNNKYDNITNKLRLHIRNHRNSKRGKR
jgi:hypothetical protein